MEMEGKEMKCVECKGRIVFDVEKHESVCAGCGRIIDTTKYEKSVEEIRRAMRRLEKMQYGAQQAMDLATNIIDNGFGGEPTVV